MSNHESQDVFRALGVVAANSKAEVLRKAAKEAGVDDCPLADIFEPVTTPPGERVEIVDE